jgi:stage II sporulation protein D
LAPTDSRITAVERAPAPIQPAASLSRPVALADVPTSLTPLSAAEESRLTELTAQGAFNAEELMDMLMNPDKRKGYLIRALRTQMPEVPSVPVPQPVTVPHGQFVFRGTGWGHGVGMSQWGAKALADQGYDFKKILLFYYPGTRLDGM